MSRRPMERTDGRRKGYTAFKATISDRVDADTLRKLQALRGPVRKADGGKPERKPRG